MSKITLITKRKVAASKPISSRDIVDTRAKDNITTDRSADHRPLQNQEVVLSKRMFTNAACVKPLPLFKLQQQKQLDKHEETIAVPTSRNLDTIVE